MTDKIEQAELDKLNLVGAMPGPGRRHAAAWAITVADLEQLIEASIAHDLDCEREGCDAGRSKEQAQGAIVVILDMFHSALVSAAVMKDEFADLLTKTMPEMEDQILKARASVRAEQDQPSE